MAKSQSNISNHLCWDSWIFHLLKDYNRLFIVFYLLIFNIFYWYRNISLSLSLSHTHFSDRSCRNGPGQAHFFLGLGQDRRKNKVWKGTRNTFVCVSYYKKLSNVVSPNKLAIQNLKYIYTGLTAQHSTV